MIDDLANAYADGYRAGARSRHTMATARLAAQAFVDADNVVVVKSKDSLPSAIAEPVRKRLAEDIMAALQDQVRKLTAERDDWQRRAEDPLAFTAIRNERDRLIKQVDDLADRIERLRGEVKELTEDRNSLQVEARRATVKAVDSQNQRDGMADELGKARSRITVLDAQLKEVRAMLDDARRAVAVADEQRSLAMAQLGERGPLSDDRGLWAPYQPELDTDGEPPLISNGELVGRYRSLAPGTTYGGLEVSIRYQPGDADRRGTGSKYTVTLPYGPPGGDPYATQD